MLASQVVHKSLRSVGGAQAQRPDKEKPMVPKENLVPRVVGTLKTGAVFHLVSLAVLSSSVVPQSIRRASKIFSFLSFRPPQLASSERERDMPLQKKKNRLGCDFCTRPAANCLTTVCLFVCLFISNNYNY